MVIPKKNSVGLQVKIFSYSLMSLDPTLKLSWYIYTIWHENLNFLRLKKFFLLIKSIL